MRVRMHARMWGLAREPAEWMLEEGGGPGRAWGWYLFCLVYTGDYGAQAGEAIGEERLVQGECLDQRLVNSAPVTPLCQHCTLSAPLLSAEPYFQPSLCFTLGKR